MNTPQINQATERIMAAVGTARQSYAAYYWEEDQGYDEEKLKQLAKKSTEALTAVEYQVRKELDDLLGKEILKRGELYAEIETLRNRVKFLEGKIDHDN